MAMTLLRQTYSFLKFDKMIKSFCTRTVRLQIKIKEKFIVKI